MKYFESNWFKLLITGMILIVVYKSVDNINGIFSFFGTLLGILMPVIIGCVIALFAYRPVCKLKGLLCKVKNRLVTSHSLVISVLIVYIIFFAVVALAFNFIVPVLYKNVEELVTKLPGYIDSLNGLLRHVEFIPQVDLSFIGEKLLSYFNFERLNEYVSVITGIANSFFSFLVSIIVSIYIILEKEHILLFFSKIKKRFQFDHKTEVVVRYIKKIINLFYSYFAGLLIDSVLIGSISTVVFASFKVPYAVFLGLAVAIGNMIPFFGPIVAALVTYLIGMIGLGPVNALWILVFQFVLGQIDGNIIQPKIVGSQVGVSPLLVLVSVTVFGGLFGPLGMILGVPICASAKLVLEDYLEDGKIDGEKREIT